MPGPGQYVQQKHYTDDMQNGALVSFKSHSPRLQMYYDLERNLSKSTLSYDKQEALAKQLVELIDRKMRERAPSNLIDRHTVGDMMSNTYETPSKRLENMKIQTGLAITNNIKHDKVPSIPCKYAINLIEFLYSWT